MTLKEFTFASPEEKQKLKQVFELVKQGKIKEAAQLADSLSDETKNQITDSILYKFSKMEMSGTGGGAMGGGFTPGTGDGVATKRAFRGTKRKKKKHNPYKLANLMNEIFMSKLQK
jgi:hypothetical protein